MSISKITSNCFWWQKVEDSWNIHTVEHKQDFYLFHLFLSSTCLQNSLLNVLFFLNQTKNTNVDHLNTLSRIYIQYQMLCQKQKQSAVLRPLRAYLLTKSQYIETGAHPLHWTDLLLSLLFSYINICMRCVCLQGQGGSEERQQGGDGMQQWDHRWELNLPCCGACCYVGCVQVATETLSLVIC